MKFTYRAKLWCLPCHGYTCHLDIKIGRRAACRTVRVTPPNPHLSTVACQVARDISPRLLLVTGSMMLIFDNQDLDGLGPRKQWQSVRHGPDGFTTAIPRHEDPADSGYRAACWKNNDRTA